MHVTPKILRLILNWLDHMHPESLQHKHAMSLCESRLALCFFWRCHWTTACWRCTAVTKVSLIAHNALS